MGTSEILAQSLAWVLTEIVTGERGRVERGTREKRIRASYGVWGFR